MGLTAVSSRLNSYAGDGAMERRTALRYRAPAVRPVGELYKKQRAEKFVHEIMEFAKKQQEQWISEEKNRRETNKVLRTKKRSK